MDLMNHPQTSGAGRRVMIRSCFKPCVRQRGTGRFASAWDEGYRYIRAARPDPGLQSNRTVQLGLGTATSWPEAPRLATCQSGSGSLEGGDGSRA